MNFPLTDIATLVPIFVLVGILFHFSNKEVKRSLEQSKEAQLVLIKKLSDSDQALKDERQIRLQELARAAEFGRMAQGLFHDLMTPLTTLLLHTEKLKHNDGARESIEKAFQASHRMARYIKDIRATLSKEETERPINLMDELENVLHLLTFQARENNIEIRVEEKSNMPWHGSPTKIRQLFTNLISNAIDAFDEITDSRKRFIEIVLETNKIMIRDNGSGIPRAVQHKIFEPFFTTKPMEKGTGIGLATVKSITEKNLRGTITFESLEDCGTTFTISFPRENINPAASHPHQ